ncbi:MAG TPA: MerR family transcriptional regulator [Thermoleophilaceae bacterium]|nr:MerR family transcriptional regulator [Thermoleophilaceae bacterium]
MSGIRTNAAADYLGVSPNTLRSWERRFEFPSPRRSAGGHRQYDLADLEALRRALLETHNISSAIDMARRRAEGPASPALMLTAFDDFDEAAADRLMEESLAVRSVERTLEELLLPALELASSRSSREPEQEFACRWATGWLHGARRVAPPATRDQGVLVFDGSPHLDAEAVHVQALEVALRRAGLRVLVLSIVLDQDRIMRALRALTPEAIVLAGSGVTLDMVGRLRYAAGRTAPDARIVEYREATPVSGAHAIPSLGEGLSQAVSALQELLEQRAGGGRSASRSVQSLRRSESAEESSPETATGSATRRT